MPVIAVGGFLRNISRGNERTYKATFPWMREKKDNITATCSHRLPRMQGGLNKDEVVQWIVTILNSSQKLILTNPEERLDSWYRGV